MLAMREVRDIYHQGVWAVAAAFRQLYEMIEAKDEQVQKLIAVATAAHLKKIEELNTRIFHLEEELLNQKRLSHRKRGGRFL
jgi:hypothetical protein